MSEQRNHPMVVKVDNVDQFRLSMTFYDETDRQRWYGGSGPPPYAEWVIDEDTTLRLVEALVKAVGKKALAKAVGDCEDYVCCLNPDAWPAGSVPLNPGAWPE